MIRITVSLLCAVSTLWGADVQRDRLRDAATRALTLFQQSQKGWYAKQTCASCHHQYQPALAYREAWEHGIPFDEAIAHADAVEAFDFADLDRAIQYNYVIEPAMDDAYRMVAAHAAGMQPNLATAVYARLLASRQDPDGHWDSFHQRPPSSYSRFTETALALRAVQLYSHPSQKTNAAAHIALGRRWLETHQPRDTEERTYQLLGLRWAGAEEATLRKLGRALLDTQQTDGGWGSLEGRASDAYSTGETLVALAESGVLSFDDPAYRRGLEFLVNTQAADGSWHVASRLHPPAPVSPPYFNTGYPYGHDQFLSATASSWAVMALVRPLGVVQHVASPFDLRQAEPSKMQPWVETVLFGSAADLKRLLDGGFDANSATNGGTTALMMAAPNAEKMKLLLDRGANVNARAKTGYSALMVAAQYRDSTAAIKLLLAHGAEVRPKPGEKPPLFNANPFFLSAYAGNAEILPTLRDAGAPMDEPMVLIGTSSTTPLMGAARFGNLAVLRTLLDLGAPADQTDGSGITALGRAVLGNQVEEAKLLIDRGADVNHVDKLGMTPLLYAGSIDFGDAAMVELLRKAGARTDMRTKDGLTALDLARKYGNTHLIAGLSR